MNQQFSAIWEPTQSNQNSAGNQSQQAGMVTTTGVEDIPGHETGRVFAEAHAAPEPAAQSAGAGPVAAAVDRSPLTWQETELLLDALYVAMTAILLYVTLRGGD